MLDCCCCYTLQAIAHSNAMPSVLEQKETKLMRGTHDVRYSSSGGGTRIMKYEEQVKQQQQQQQE